MRAVIQRVKSASVTVESGETRSIGQGLLVLFASCEDDTFEIIPKFCDKIAGLRIFSDQNGKMNLSALDLNYEVLIVPNFTLFADTKSGMRPSFSYAAKKPFSLDAYNEFCRYMAGKGLKSVKTGEFGDDMSVKLENDGPVTVIIDTKEWKK